MRNGKYGLFRNFGWKKNILAIAGCFVLCLALDIVQNRIAGVRVLSGFDLRNAILPLLGFTTGIWGVLGSLLNSLLGVVWLVTLDVSGILNISILAFFMVCISGFVYSALPVVLWYSIPVRGEEKISFPRMDTAAHVVKYYLIMLLDAAVYVALISFNPFRAPSLDYLMYYAATFAQYLNTILIAGIPLLIILAALRYRTIAINERMVLAFLIVGVLAAVIAGTMLYLITNYLDPTMFSAYEYILNSNVLNWSEEVTDAINRYSSFSIRFDVMLSVLLNTMLIVEILFMRNIERKVTRPILDLSDVLNQYKMHAEGELDPETVAERCEPYQNGYGEVSSLTKTCVDMVREIDNYTTNIREVTAEKERIGAELNVAANIQRDMLPKIFPPFPERTEIDLFASMNPAKEVGGDFYDFYFSDHNHLVLTIADVSGKGVPASLFMVTCKTLLKNHAQSGGSPREILTYVNHQLYRNNDSFMFCTVWLGVLDLRNGKLKAANAGHEYPAIRRKDGDFELLRDKHDSPLGIRDGVRYREYELTLNPGDTLFQYTDGVTEAADPFYNLFGEKQMVEVLNEKPDSTPEELIGRVQHAITVFAGEAPQSDDITMLSLTYNGGADPEKAYKRLTVPARVDSLDKVNAFIEEQLENIGCSGADSYSICLAAEEIFVNIANYAYDGKEGDATVMFLYEKEEETAELVFSDSGMPFDPTGQPSPDISLRSEEREIGGLGIHIVKKRMDHVTYSYENGKNVLIIRKQIKTKKM